MQPHFSIDVFAMRLRIARKAKRTFSGKIKGILAGIDESSASARMNQYGVKHVPDFWCLQNCWEVLELPTAYFYVEDDLLLRYPKEL